MSKRINSLIVCVLFIANMLAPIRVYASNQFQYESGFISVNSNGNLKNYPTLKSKEELFLKAADIGEIAGYEFVSGAYYNYSKPGNTDVVTYVDIATDGTAKAMGHQYDIDIIEYNNDIYFPFEKMLYLLHSQWYTLEKCVYVIPLQYTIIDFLSVDGGYYQQMWDNMVTQADLLVNDESNISRAFKDAIAEAFNDFDPKMFVIWWPGEGWVPSANTAYEEALLQLAVDDQAFLDSYGQAEITDYLNEANFRTMSSALSNAKTMLDLPSNIADGASDIDEIVNWISKNPDSLKQLKFNLYGELNPPDLKAWAKELGYVTDAFEVISLFEAASEVKQRASRWGRDYIDQISVLTDFDSMGYNTLVVERIKTVAKNLILEYADPLQAASDRAALEATSLMLSKVFDESVFGKFFAVLSAGIAIGKTDKGISSRFEAHDLSSTVNCLIKVENLAMREMHRSYLDLLSSGVNGSFEESELSRLRNSTMLALRANIRNWSFIYYLNQQLNDDKHWIESDAAATIRSQIFAGYALLCQLVETEKTDCLLLVDSFNNMHCYENGKMREPIPLDVFILGNIPADEQHQMTIINGTSDSNNAYEAILNEYREACATSIEEFLDNHETKYPHVNPSVMEDYHVSFHQSPGAAPDEIIDEEFELFYAYYDIDGNGTQELLIYRAFHEMYICDLYGFNGQSAVKLFPDVILLDNEVDSVYVHIYESGEILELSGDSNWYRLAEDGYSLVNTEGTDNALGEIQPDWEVLAKDIDNKSTTDQTDSKNGVAVNDLNSEMSGAYGKLTWTYDGEGTLTFSGSGALDEASVEYEIIDGFEMCIPPWHEYVSDIRNVVIEEGITAVYAIETGLGDGAVPWGMTLDYASTIVFPKSVQYIEDGALDGFGNLKLICGYADSVAYEYAARYGYTYRVIDTGGYIDTNHESNMDQYYEETENNIFSLLPDEFVFSSGAGGWATTLHVDSDGSFYGKYMDSDAGDTADDYPYGTIYICDFYGSFSTPKVINQFVYKMHLDSLDVCVPDEDIEITDGIRYIASDPYGFDDANEFYLYLPGARVDEMKEGFLLWAHMVLADSFPENQKTLPTGVYGIYNIGGEEGFVSWANP